MSAHTINPVVHFEIGCRDINNTKQFYKQAFGWEPDQAGIIHKDQLPGIPGHFVSLGHEPHHYVLVYIQVADINEYIGKVENAGGKKLVGPVPLPDGRQFAWVTDTDGNVIGLITPVK